MTRKQLEHVIRAAGAIAEVDEIVVIGSQAILGAFPDAPDELLMSREVDLYPAKETHKAILIDGSIGEGSLFDEEFKYYAHGVGPETAILPASWQSRLISVKNEFTRGICAQCLHPVDIAASKLAAGRDKDIRYVQTMLQYGLSSCAAIAVALEELPESRRGLAKQRFLALQSSPLTAKLSK